jgi:hypothetical protein
MGEMNTRGAPMTTRAAGASLRRTARVAGFAYLFIVIGATLSFTLSFSKVVIPGDVATTAANILARERLFRLGLTYDVTMSLAILVLAWAHYVILETVDRSLALLGLCLRMAEAVLGAVPILFCLTALQLLNGEAHLTAFPPEQLRALAGLFLEVRTPAMALPMVFTALGSIVFLGLLVRSRYVPRALAGFGVVSYVPVLAYALANFVVGKPATSLMGNLELACYMPSVLFELAIGAWLLVKGVDVTQTVEGASALT